MRLTKNFTTAALKIFRFFSEEDGQSIQQGGHCLFRQHIENGKVAEIGSHFPLRNPMT